MGKIVFLTQNDNKICYNYNTLKHGAEVAEESIHLICVLLKKHK